MNNAQRTLFFQRLAAANPAPTTELIYADHFQLLIAVILSAQTTDVAVNKATKTLFSQAPDAYALAKLTLAEIETHIKNLGLYHNKAKHISATAGLLAEKFSGHVPDNRTDLQALPGVGRKTANVVLNTAFGYETMAVDTHIFRVANRTGLARGKTPLAVEKGLLNKVPKNFLRHAHHWLILHGRYICLARKPRCAICPVRDLCDDQRPKCT